MMTKIKQCENLLQVKISNSVVVNLSVTHCAHAMLVVQNM